MGNECLVTGKLEKQELDVQIGGLLNEQMWL